MFVHQISYAQAGHRSSWQWRNSMSTCRQQAQHSAPRRLDANDLPKSAVVVFAPNQRAARVVGEGRSTRSTSGALAPSTCKCCTLRQRHSGSRQRLKGFASHSGEIAAGIGSSRCGQRVAGHQLGVRTAAPQQLSGVLTFKTLVVASHAAAARLASASAAVAGGRAHVAMMGFCLLYCIMHHN